MAAEFHIGDLWLRPDERRLYAQGGPVPMGARAFDLLLALIENRDRVLGKDELLARVWPGVVVEEGNLAVQISTLRKLLGSHAISTIPGRGYRFTAPVTEALGSVDARSVATVEAPRVGTAGAALQSQRQTAYDALMRTLRATDATAAPASRLGEGAVGHVPAASTPLVGRAAALDETLHVLQTVRCLTLTGAGGSGKTRLALALAHVMQAQVPGGVWWVELDALHDARQLTETIASSIGPLDPHRPAQQALVARLQGRKALLVLDNCEHLIDSCAELVARLLRELPLLQVLATSRESLRVAGEVAWRVPPLEVPPQDASQRMDDLLRNPSVELLVQCIRRHDGHFVPAPDHVSSLVRICRGLEGLPLALELVAAQVGALTLAQIAEGLGHSLPLLTVGPRGGQPHHQTMAAAVDWGYQLLAEADRVSFLQLAVFAGGWTLEGAQAACQGLPPADVPALLGRLNRVSMVQAQEVDGSLRYRMLEPIRQFAAARLDAQGQSADVRHRLLAWYLVRCKAVAAQLTGPRAAEGYRFLSAEFDNLRALLAWSRLADLENGLQLAAGLWRFWQVKGHAQELLRWFDEALPLTHDVPRAVLAEASNSAGIMARTCGRYADAVRLHTDSLMLQRELGNRRGEANALNNLCVVARDQYDHPAVERHGHASLRIAREIGDRALEGLGLMHLGTALRGQGRAVDAKATFEQSLQIFSELGDRRSQGTLLNYLGALALSDGQWLEAGRCFDESLALNLALGDHWGLGISTFNQAALKVATADERAALPILMQSFAHYGRAGARRGVEECFELLARIAQRFDSLQRAAWCWGVVAQLEADMGKVLQPTAQAGRLQALRALQAQLPDGLFEAAFEAGRQEPLDAALRAVLPDGGLD